MSASIAPAPPPSPRPRRWTWAWTLAVVAGAIALGFALTAGGVATWDSLAHEDRSRWLVHDFGLPTTRPADHLLDETLRWYGPLWALFLGILSELPFRFVHDPDWVQHAFNFALYPVGLWAVVGLLGRGGVRRSTAVLAAALLVGAIRLGGHALVNVNDFPMAMLSLLVMLYLWVKLREVDAGARAAGGIARPTLVWLGVVAMVPFLVRPPVALQPLTLGAFLALYARVALGGARPARRLEQVAVPLLAGLAFAVAAWPALWARGRVLPLEQGVRVFAHFPWLGAVRFFGHEAMSNALPRLYPLVWLPVMLTPATFVLLLVGLGRAAARPAPLGPAFPLGGAAGRAIDLSLGRWLALHAALLWLGVVVLHPTVYDEERHLLFLYPPLLVLAALGLDDLGEGIKYALAALVVAASLFSYAQWGRYAYVYESPLVGAGAGRFNGDYWGACVPLAVEALAGRVPPGADVVVPGPVDAAVIQYARLRAGPRAASGFGPYRILARPAGGPATFIFNNRTGSGLGRALRDVAAGRARELWRTAMPSGEPACVLVAYDGLGARPPSR
ncbi:MAG TPA: hypothetical protein VHO06_00455 [Polyangia bacterium]|nr:hypothetical protein [Polyangia bacterium]